MHIVWARFENCKCKVLDRDKTLSGSNLSTNSMQTTMHTDSIFLLVNSEHYIAIVQLAAHNCLATNHKVKKQKGM